MKNPAFWIMVLIAMFASGCITSESPFFRESDMIVDDRIVGTYDSKDGPAILIFKDNDPYNPKQYIVVVTGDGGRNNRARPGPSEPGCQMKFTAALFQVGTNRFLDILPQLEACDHVGGVPPSAIEILQSLTLQPLHMVVKVNINTNGVQFGIVDQQGMNAAVKAAPEYFQRKPGRLPRMIADRERQREFLLRFGGNTTIFKMGEFQMPRK